MMENVQIRPPGKFPVTIQVPKHSPRLRQIDRRIAEDEREKRKLETKLVTLNGEYQELDQSSPSAESGLRLATLKREIVSLQRQIAILTAHLERDRDEARQWGEQIAGHLYTRKKLWREFGEAYEGGPTSDAPIFWMRSAGGESTPRSRGDVKRELVSVLQWLLSFSGYDKELAQELSNLQNQEGQP